MIATATILKTVLAWVKENWAALVLLSALFFAALSHSRLDARVKVLTAEKAAVAAELKTANATLVDLKEKREAMALELQEAQAKASQIKTVTQVKVQKILTSPPPATCEDARKALIEASWEDE